VPAIGLRSRVLSGDANRITNAGHSWHWTGTGFLGQDAHVAAFAHRTTAGGPYRNIHFLGTGDQIILTAADSRQYTYEVVRRDLTNSRVDNILAADRVHPSRLHADEHRLAHHRHRPADRLARARLILQQPPDSLARSPG
jgi:sortase (surface protein transpeptidase)